MARFGRAAAVLTAVESARRWARNNPDKARSYIDRASGFVDQRTGGRYHSTVGRLSEGAKKNLTGHDTIPGSTVRDTGGTKGASRPFPDGRL